MHQPGEILMCQPKIKKAVLEAACYAWSVALKMLRRELKARGLNPDDPEIMRQAMGQLHQEWEKESRGKSGHFGPNGYGQGLMRMAAEGRCVRHH